MTATVNSITRVELGCRGHFIGAAYCLWSRHTQVGTKWRVSTVGDYRPNFYPSGKMQPLGADPDSFYETMVFATNAIPVEGSGGCGCLDVVSWNEVRCVRYATAGQAQRGHEAIVAQMIKAESEAAGVGVRGIEFNDDGEAAKTEKKAKTKKTKKRSGR